MPRFDTDSQRRGLIFLFGVIGFTAEAVVIWLGGPKLPDLMTGGLITMIVGPVAGNAIDKYQEQRREERAARPPSSHPQPTDPSPSPEDP